MPVLGPDGLPIGHAADGQVRVAAGSPIGVKFTETTVSVISDNLTVAFEPGAYVIINVDDIEAYVSEQIRVARIASNPLGSVVQ